MLKALVVPTNPTLTVKAKAKGSGGNGVLVRIDPMVGNSYNILANAALAPKPAPTGISFFLHQLIKSQTIKI